MTRRTLFAAPAATIAAAALGADDEKLALDGGKPVRSTALPARSYPGAQFIDQQEQREVAEVIESKTLFRFYGPNKPTKVARFEEEFARFIGAKYVLAVTSGTAALHCALTALEVGPGDEVILPAWTWYSCYNAILLTGALPVFGEVDESFSLDPNDVEKKITSRTKAIMAVHLYGGPADLDRILAVARKRKVRVLEDAAQSVGAQYKGRRLGSLGDIGIFSFQTSKVITAGEGGAVVTSDPRLFERAARFHDLGGLRPVHETLIGKAAVDWYPGVNYRMNEMTGGVMRAQLRKLDTIVNMCRQSAQAIKEQIASVPGLKLRRGPDPAGDIGLHVCPILKSKEQRAKFLAAMRAENVAASEPSGSPYLPAEPYIEKKAAPHPQWPSFTSAQGKAMQYGAACCPRTLDLRNRAAFVGIGPRYTASDARDIAVAIRKVYRALS